MTPSNPGTDREILTKQAYATGEHLTVRYRTHEMYSRPKIDFQKWVIETVQWRGDEWVLDVGAGPGTYFESVLQHAPRGHYIAGDLSFGMAQQASHLPNAGAVRVVNLDVQQLPFREGQFDIVMANHMLYHVPELPRALAEIRRVLRRDGMLIAASNSEHTMPEFDTLARRACTLLGYPRHEFKTASPEFALENGPGVLSHYFRAVARYDIPSAFHFPEVEPALAYLNSMRALREPQLPPEITWDSFMGVMENQIIRLIRHFGELQVHKLAGALVATNGGGFAAGYLRMLDEQAAGSG